MPVKEWLSEACETKDKCNPNEIMALYALLYALL